MTYDERVYCYTLTSRQPLSAGGLYQQQHQLMRDSAWCWWWCANDRHSQCIDGGWLTTSTRRRARSFDRRTIATAIIGIIIIIVIGSDFPSNYAVMVAIPLFITASRRPASCWKPTSEFLRTFVGSFLRFPMLSSSFFCSFHSINFRVNSKMLNVLLW